LPEFATFLNIFGVHKCCFSHEIVSGVTYRLVSYDRWNTLL
jgi:hypothetical protein